MNTVEVRGAYKSYGKGDKRTVVLNNLNLTVSPGSIYGLIGSSGCGKTTLLSCILGMVSLDDGCIRVLGQKAESNEVLKVGHLVGYMPQETALVGEFTVKETVFYFGNIFQVDHQTLKDRYKIIKALLELPPDDTRVENCSGGEQRRISFAAAIIHEPDLLVLDEPTVGLDPLLRERIWDFLWNVTRTTKLSVIITTHYIDEAQRADCVGLMRDGALLAQDSPANIMSSYGVGNLEEAFLEFCLKQSKTSRRIIDGYVNTVIDSPLSKVGEKEVRKLRKPKEKTFYRPQVIKALLSKHMYTILRQPSGVTFMTLLPIFVIVLFYWAIGGNPTGLKLAVVNKEVQSSQECSLTSAVINLNDRNSLQKLSCRFLDEIDETLATKVYFDSFDEAFAAAKKGKVTGIIEFESNFTIALLNVLQMSDNSTANDLQIKIYLDQTDMHLTYFLHKRLSFAYKHYSEKLMTSFQLPKSLQSLPLSFEEPLYGSFHGDQKSIMAPNMMLQMVFYAAAGLSVAVFIVDRKEGFWNRSILAGVRAGEMIFAQVFVHSLIVFIQVVELIVVAEILYGFTISGCMTILLTVQALTGLFFGIFVSIFSPNVTVGNGVILGLSSPILFLSGMIWPIQGFPDILKYLSTCLPFTLPSVSVNDIISKGCGILSPSVMRGLGISLTWMLLCMFLALKTLKWKKYCRNS